MRINVNILDLYDAALRYERIAFVLEDTAADLTAIRAELNSMGDIGMALRADLIHRKADDLAYRLRGLCAKLRFAAGHYEYYDRQVKGG